MPDAQWGTLHKSIGNERINNITKYINARACARAKCFTTKRISDENITRVEYMERNGSIGLPRVLLACGYINVDQRILN